MIKFPTIKITLLLTLCAMLFVLPSCINLKSDFPKIVYYKLTQTPINETEATTLYADKSIFIKSFKISSELETAKIMVSEDNWRVKKYNYHQWTAPLNEILTEFTINRISRYGAFRKGVSSSAFSTNNDFVLECNVLNCVINNSTTTARPNNVELSISATLLRPDGTTLSYSPMFSKTYTKSLARKDNSLETAVDALSILMSEITDAILVDIFQHIK
jgi:ABC-type uncharacterized transport system auxiliary subunit